jgi:hypothetical protein
MMEESRLTVPETWVFTMLIRIRHPFVLSSGICLTRFFGALAFVSIAVGQSLGQSSGTNTSNTLPSYADSETAPAARLAGTSQLAPPPAVPLAALQPLLRWGPLTLQSHLLYQLSYGNGLQASPGQSSSSLINEVDPGILLQWGSHWSLGYTPTLRFYSDRALHNTYDNAVTLTGGTTYEDWSFGLSQSYASSSQPLIETAAQSHTLAKAESRKQKAEMEAAGRGKPPKAISRPR